jgi:hypothetical protein
MSNPYKRLQIEHEYQAKKFGIKSHDPNKEIVYPNQAAAANEIFNAFISEDKVAVTLIALPQAGKTGTFLEVAYKMCTIDSNTKAIDHEQLLFITGMSDREWKTQTKGDMLTSFEKRVKHRGQFKSLPTILKDIRNSLIIIDECHIAAEKEQTMSAMLKAAGLLNIDELRKRRIFLLEVSATPGSTLYDTQKWGADNHKIVILKESPLYVGFRDFIAENRLHNSYDLTQEGEVVKLFTFIEQAFPQPRYHIIRLSGKRDTGPIEQHAKARDWYVNNHNASSRLEGLDYIMTKPPQRHSIILIKEFWRAGKRLCDKHVGIVHEPQTDIEDTNVTSQGLIGRLCGNDKRKGVGAPHAFCNTALIHDYLAWIDAKGDYSAVKRYKSKNLTAKNGRITSQESFVHHSNVYGIEVTDVAESEKEIDPNSYRIYTDESVVRGVCKFLGSLFIPAKESAEGFKLTSLRTTTSIVSMEEALRYVASAYIIEDGKITHSRVYYPCYVDVKDKNTLRFVFIVRPGTDPRRLQECDEKFPPIRP